MTCVILHAIIYNSIIIINGMHQILKVISTITELYYLKTRCCVGLHQFLYWYQCWDPILAIFDGIGIGRTCYTSTDSVIC